MPPQAAYRNPGGQHDPLHSCSPWVSIRPARTRQSSSLRTSWFAPSYSTTGAVPRHRRCHCSRPVSPVVGRSLCREETHRTAEARARVLARNGRDRALEGIRFSEPSGGGVDVRRRNGEVFTRVGKS